MRNFFRFFLLLDGALIGYFALQADSVGLLNSQIGALSALAVALGSFLGYRRTIREQAGIQDGGLPDERDGLDRIDDPHGLFDDSEPQNGELSDTEVKALFDEEKARIKQTSSLKTLFLTSRSIVSPFRLIAYGLLLLGFFWLEGNGYLQIFPYLSGFFVLPLAALLASFFNR